MADLFFLFMAEALVPSLLFYGLRSWMRRSAGVPWRTHVATISTICFMTALARLAAGSLLGGSAALGNSFVWSFLFPGALSFCAVAVIAAIKAREEAEGASELAQPRVPESSDGPDTEAPVLLPRPMMKAQPKVSRPATPAMVMLIIAAAVGAGAVVVLAVLLWALFSSAEWQTPAASSQIRGDRAPRLIVDPSSFPPRQGSDREADPLWRTLRADWVARNQMWLEVPGAEEAFDQAVLAEEAQAPAASYPELIERAARRARDEMYQRNRLRREE